MSANQRNFEELWRDNHFKIGVRTKRKGANWLPDRNGTPRERRWEIYTLFNNQLLGWHYTVSGAIKHVNSLWPGHLPDESVAALRQLYDVHQNSLRQWTKLYKEALANGSTEAKNVHEFKDGHANYEAAIMHVRNQIHTHKKHRQEVVSQIQSYGIYYPRDPDGRIPFRLQYRDERWHVWWRGVRLFALPERQAALEAFEQWLFANPREHNNYEAAQQGVAS